MPPSGKKQVTLLSLCKQIKNKVAHKSGRQGKQILLSLGKGAGRDACVSGGWCPGGFPLGSSCCSDPTVHLSRGEKGQECQAGSGIQVLWWPNLWGSHCSAAFEPRHQVTTGSSPRAEPVPGVGSVPYGYHCLLDNMVARNEIGWPRKKHPGLKVFMV